MSPEYVARARDREPILYMKVIPSVCLSLIVPFWLAGAAHAQSVAVRNEPVSGGDSSLTLPEVSVSAAADTTFFAPDTASQGVVTGKEIEEQPRSRVGEVLELVPGLIATQHSGEGKANQYFLRGFNLDHGTDIDITLDEMPVNMRTHAHGQGSARSGRIMIAKRSDSTRRQSRDCPSRLAEPAPLQADPEKLTHPRRQVEGGNIARHAEQIRAKPGHEVADNDPDQEHLGRDA